MTHKKLSLVKEVIQYLTQEQQSAIYGQQAINPPSQATNRPLVTTKTTKTK